VSGAELTVLAPLVVFGFALLAGLVEEPGWRGYALERLGLVLSMLAAGVVIGDRRSFGERRSLRG
jgi:membrane protease YdiL (CAAX protease family)